MPARLIIDLMALAQNYHNLQNIAKGSKIGAVIKSNAYGLGASAIGKALYQEGCRFYFVANLAEALSLKAALPTQAEIAVLHGAAPGQEHIFADNGFLPVLNYLASVQNWANFCQSVDKIYPAILQVDTGMHRLGLPEDEVALLLGGNQFKKLKFSYILSHLANSDKKEDPRNLQQLEKFQHILQYFPDSAYSLANSAGIFLGEAYHFNLIRPGIALYGKDENNPQSYILQNVVQIEAPILQIQTLKKGEETGYNSTFRAPSQRLIATVEIGYADGLPRALSNKAFAFFKGDALPIIGNISMDSLMVDITDSQKQPKVGDYVNFIDNHQSLDTLAKKAGTIPYEILTRLNPRLERIYKREKEAINASFS